MQKKNFNFSRKLLDLAANDLRLLLDIHQPIKERRELEEKEHLQIFFNNHPIVLCTLAHLVEMSELDVDEMQFEFDLWGNFRCDVGFGNSTTNTYCLIELEGAQKNSLFKNKPKNYPKYSDRLECGYSQIIDWFFKIDEIKNTSGIKRRFAGEYPRVNAVLIIGRSHFLNTDLERNRFNWRRDNTLIGAKNVNCLTYDELLVYFESKTKEMEDYKTK